MVAALEVAGETARADAVFEDAMKAGVVDVVAGEGVIDLHYLSQPETTHTHTCAHTRACARARTHITRTHITRTHMDMRHMYP